MGRKKIHRKHIEKGKFYVYFYYGKGHPALIIDKNDNLNMYTVVWFSHKRGSKVKKLNKNINSNDDRNCFISKKPITDKRNRLSSKEWKHLKISKEDKAMIVSIRRKEPKIANHKKKKTRDR